MGTEDIKLRIAIVSDLHFVDKGVLSDSPSTNLVLSSINEPPELWQKLLDFVAEKELHADLLVCPGDITTHADVVGLKYAWGALNKLAESFNAELLAVATGNHDVQTRPQVVKEDNPIRTLNIATDLTENLRQLDPPYPINVFHECSFEKAHERRIKYFGADFTIYETEAYRLVVFNSCGRHTTEKREYERGRAARSAIEWLEIEMKHLGRMRDKIGILVCHHHPIQHSELGLGSYDQMQNGTELIDVLLRYGEWIIVHGHKHHAKISYSAGGAKRATVFASGTLSANKNLGKEGLNNQFYIVELSLHRQGILGQVNAFKWEGNNWKETKKLSDGVYTGCGFGQTSPITALADQINDLIEQLEPFCWEKLKQKIPDLRYLLPQDIKHLQEELEDLNIAMNKNDHDEIVTVEKSAELDE